MRRGRTAAGWVATGLAAGVAIGLALWTRYQDRHARSLFSSRKRRRWAALGRLAGDVAAGRAVDTLGVLREYVAWERDPRLRRRGRAILDRLASTLD